MMLPVNSLSLRGLMLLGEISVQAACSVKRHVEGMAFFIILLKLSACPSLSVTVKRVVWLYQTIKKGLPILIDHMFRGSIVST